MEVILNGFILMVITQIWKWLVGKFGLGTTRYGVHGFLFVISFIYAASKYWGEWDLFLASLGGVWASASGLYEILVETLAPIIPTIRSTSEVR